LRAACHPAPTRKLPAREGPQAHYENKQIGIAKVSFSRQLRRKTLDFIWYQRETQTLTTTLFLRLLQETLAAATAVFINGESLNFARDYDIVNLLIYAFSGGNLI
jgi:hypothetical protein